MKKLKKQKKDNNQTQEFLNKKYKNKLLEITWYDANQQDVDNGYIKALTGEEDGMDLMVENTTYGKIAKILKKVVIIIHEVTTAEKCGTDCTIIPRGWIISPEDMKTK